MQDEVQTTIDEDGKVDAMAATLMVTIIVATVVFWLVNQ